MRAIVLVSTVQNPEEPLLCTNQQLARVAENEIPNDFDLIALEAAVQCKESGWIDEVLIFSLSPERTHLQKALAMGADQAVWGHAENAQLSPQIVAQTAVQTFGNDPETIWFAGKLGVNFESHCTAQILSQTLGCPCLGSAFHIEKSGELWRIRCEDESGVPKYAVRPPFVVTADLRLNTPRFPGLPQLIRAKKKPVREIAMEMETAVLLPRVVQNAADRRRNCQFLRDLDDIVAQIRGGIA